MLVGDMLNDYVPANKPVKRGLYLGIFRLLSMLTIQGITTATTAEARKLHLVYWNTSNTLFRVDMPKDLRVSFEDQIAFICPNLLPPTNKVFWTTDVILYKSCQQSADHLSLIHLLVDCFHRPPAYRLVIEISVLISQLPPASVQPLTSIYFLADAVLCRQKNMHMNVTVTIPRRKYGISEGRNIALADSAVVVSDDPHDTALPPPITSDVGLSVLPKSNRFIGLLVAYILITLFVVYMVVCAVCFQPQKCLALVGRGSGEADIASLSLTPLDGRCRFFNLNCIRCGQSENSPTSMGIILPRTNPHFSRSVDGERFLHYPLDYGQSSTTLAGLDAIQQPQQQYQRGNQYWSGGHDIPIHLTEISNSDAPMVTYYDQNCAY